MRTDARGAAEKHRLLLAGLVAVMAAEVWIVGRMALSRARPPLAWGLGGDMLLLGALGAWLAGREACATLRWERSLRLGMLAAALFCGLAATAGRGRVALPAALQVLELCVQIALGVAVVRAVRAPGDPWSKIAAGMEAMLPVHVAAAALIEVKVLYAAGCALLRRGPRPLAGDARRFVPISASRSGWLLPFAALASLVELGAVHLLIRALWPGHRGAHAALAALTLYGVLWLAGDRWWMWRTAHVIEGGVLRLQLGLRCEGEIPLGAIQRALLLRDDRERRRVQPRHGRNPRVSPFDPPNVHLCLAEPCSLRGLFGRKRAVRHLDLFVDRPEQFVEAIGGARS